MRVAKVVGLVVMPPILSAFGVTSAVLYNRFRRTEQKYEDFLNLLNLTGWPVHLLNETGRSDVTIAATLPALTLSRTETQRRVLVTVEEFADIADKTHEFRNDDSFMLPPAYFFCEMAVLSEDAWTVDVSKVQARLTHLYGPYDIIVSKSVAKHLMKHPWKYANICRKVLVAEEEPVSSDEGICTRNLVSYGNLQNPFLKFWS